MNLRFLLDTNVVIAILRRQPGPLRERLAAESGRIAVSSITVSELSYGVERSAEASENRRAVDQFLALIEVLALDAIAAQHAGVLGEPRVGQVELSDQVDVADDRRQRGPDVVGDVRDQLGAEPLLA